MPDRYILPNGSSNYADRTLQPGSGVLIPGSGQLPKYEYGISSAYPSPSGNDNILFTKPNRDPVEYDDSVFDYEGLINNLSGPKVAPVEDLSYLNDYIHYYPKRTEVKTLYSREIRYSPVRIQALNFARLDYSATQRYNYKED